MTTPRNPLYDPEAHLAHYTTAEAAFAKILPSGRLRMNPYRRMRDPLENKELIFNSVGGWGNSAEISFGDLQGAIRRVRDAMRILSFTQGQERTSTDHLDAALFRCSWARPRMWEQYAENHSGVCLVFDRARLVEAIRYELARVGSYWDREVVYNLGGFATSDAAAIDYDPTQGLSIEEAVAVHAVTYAQEFFFLKTEDWASEREYRFVLEPASTDPDPADERPHFVSFADALRYVLVGERFSLWQSDSAQRISEAAGAELRFMDWEHGFPVPFDEPPERGTSDAIPTQPRTDPAP